MTATAAAQAVGQVVAAAAGAIAPAEPAQLPLFAVPVERGAGETDEAAAARAAAVQAGAERRVGAGRPPGAVNKSTRELREYLLARGGHPLVELMRWAMHTPQSLAREIGCEVAEAFDRLTRLRLELAPYFAARMAPTDDKGQVVPFLNLMLGGSGGGEAPGAPPWAYLDADPRPQQNQALSDGAEAKSHEGLSHGEPSV